MPARKSCASRIIGDRAVRPIAVSTSPSIEARVPSTISSSTGSATGHHQVADRVDGRGEAGVQGYRRPVLLDDRGSGDGGAGGQVGTPPDGRLDVVGAEEHRPRPRWAGAG